MNYKTETTLLASVNEPEESKDEASKQEDDRFVKPLDHCYLLDEETNKFYDCVISVEHQYIQIRPMEQRPVKTFFLPEI